MRQERWQPHALVCLALIYCDDGQHCGMCHVGMARACIGSGCAGKVLTVLQDLVWRKEEGPWACMLGQTVQSWLKPCCYKWTSGTVIPSTNVVVETSVLPLENVWL